MKTFYFHTPKDVVRKNRNRATVAGVLSKDGTYMLLGMGKTHSKFDNFDKEIGRKVAEGRAIKKPMAKIPINPSDNLAEVFVDSAITLLQCNGYRKVKFEKPSKDILKIV